MRIVIDMQGAQTESRFRGIGRYTLSLTQAIVRNRGEHEIILALSGLFPDTIESIRSTFDGLLPQENIRVWYAPGPVRECDPANTWRRKIAERIREAFLAALHADVVLITSLFEGLGDDAVTSVGILDAHVPVAVILYDLIPLISPDAHFKSSKIHQEYYARKIVSLKQSRRLLAISESVRREALGTLRFDEHDVVNISGACDASFQVLDLSPSEKRDVCSKAGINRPFVMYTGGADDRKNLHRLIRAYANLPQGVRNAYQLVLAGKMPEGHVQDLLRTARKCGLASEDMVVTGYVEDGELLMLYNSCALFVFPSLHEGFGIPPLEAMACGAPVIVANATSLPEVVGCDDAMFDPESIKSISNKIEQALTDESFRAGLVARGLVRARTFSWDESASRALKALQDFDRGHTAVDQPLTNVEKTSIFKRCKKKILLVKLDHMGDFILAIPAITRLRARYPYASIDIVLGSWNAPIARELKLFDNIYTFDFFKKKSEELASTNDAKVAALLTNLGMYDIAIDLRRQRDTRFLLVKTQAQKKVGYETFDAAIDGQLDILLRAYPDVPFEMTPLNGVHISTQMLELVNALPEDINDFVFFPELDVQDVSKTNAIAIFPKAGNDVREWGKANFKALTELLVGDDRIEKVNLYFANADEAQKSSFQAGGKLHVHTGLGFAELTRSLSENAVCVSNNSFGAHIASYLGLVVIGIYGGQETVSEWAPVFGNSYVIHSGASCSPCHIAKRSDCTRGLSCLSDISVEFVYSKVMEAVLWAGQNGKNRQKEPVSELWHSKNSEEIAKCLIKSIADLGSSDLGDDEQMAIAECIAASIAPLRSTRHLFIDVSFLVHIDARSGIQRVVRSILRILLEHPPAGYVVILVYAGVSRPGYLHAARFTRTFLGQAVAPDVVDEPIDFCAGDIFLGLDLQPQVVPAQKALFRHMRRHGVRVKFVVYDLLCVTMPQYFMEGTEEGFRLWLETVTENDEAICISRAVANELSDWVQHHGPKRLRPFRIEWFHLGADVENSVPTLGLPDDAKEVLQELSRRPTFLTIGTIEPRKGQSQTLSAFELLWEQGTDVTLVIVGKQGWMVESLVDKLRNHCALNKRLFWLEGISDEYLEKIYAASTCLIAASEGEGFGLPLIEAAQHKLPIIARDIPVFREVAGEHAFYFKGMKPANLADAITEWLALYGRDEHPKSDDMPWLTWEESAKMLIDRILDEK